MLPFAELSELTIHRGSSPEISSVYFLRALVSGRGSHLRVTNYENTGHLRPRMAVLSGDFTSVHILLFGMS